MGRAELQRSPHTMYVICKVGKSLKEYTTGLFYEDGCGVLLALPIIILIALSFMLTLCALPPSTLGVIFLLKMLRTIPVTEEPSSARRGLIAARIALSFHKILYGLTSYIASVSEGWGWLRELFRYGDALSHSGFFVGWLVVLPTLFLFITTIVLLPFSCPSFSQPPLWSPFRFWCHTRPFLLCPIHKEGQVLPYDRLRLLRSNFGGLHGYLPIPRRASSLMAITIIPFIVAPIDYILENFELNKEFGRVVRLVPKPVMSILLFIYVPARLSLIAQALALLRNQPQTAFLAVDYIPHVF